MDKNDRIKILNQIDLFRAFSDAELSEFADSISEVNIEPETVLFEEGTVGHDMYILLEGTMKIFKDKRAITSISPIDYIGEMAIIEDKPRSATVISTEQCRLLRITSKQFETYFAHQPKSLVYMLTSLSQRIRKDTVLISEEFQKANILIHDMRNTISAFLLLDLMLNDSLTDEQLNFINLMRKSRIDLSEMMDEALANAKRLQFLKRMKESSLQELIEEIIRTIALHKDLKDREIVFDLDKSIKPFPFYRVEIRRVITNLVYNAAQASKAGEIISIKLSESDGNAIVEISDNGCGIPEKLKSQIFIPHFTTKENGNGLGLASCKQIIEQKHDGKLSFVTEINKGTTFSFSIPMNPIEKINEQADIIG